MHASRKGSKNSAAKPERKIAAGSCLRRVSFGGSAQRAGPQVFSTRETTAHFKTRFRFTAMLVVIFSLTAVGALLWTQFSSQDELRRQHQARVAGWFALH